MLIKVKAGNVCRPLFVIILEKKEKNRLLKIHIMKRSTLVIVALFFFALAAQGQRQETLFGGSGFHFSGIWGAFTNNYSFYGDSKNGYHSGGNIGLEFGRAIFVGYAWSSLRDDIPLENIPGSFRLRQNNFIVSIIPQSYQVIHPTITFQTGGGRVSVNDGPSDRIYVFQPSAGVEINIFKWFHLGLEGGYRIVTGSDLPGIRNDELSSPFGQLNLRFGCSWGRVGKRR